ncbi:uncharacterized protein LOC127851887 [Dreissena polymorpha]|uniref:Death domain-containing protein n=1 Tax=Dreissena polymorpha TaxID=45954 RepID=A0A9D4HVR1_DREPO|nr:uncharacterized protein LOC127851887 [Dreissena polymorpha]KAH3734707.1 hypothetical protein DPMN_041151 [Dreissena polymorpha]
MDNSQEDIKENREIVLNYMEYLDVMAKPLIREEADEANEHIDTHETVEVPQLNFKLLDFHIVPCRLKNPPPPISRFTSPENCEKTPVLCFAFVENFMPPSFFHRLVAVCISTWPISKSGPHDQLYNGLAVFDIHKTECLTIWYKDHIIYARISCFRKDRITDFNVGLCQEVRLILLKSLRKFVSQSLENPRTPIAFEEYIQCPEMEESVHNEGMFRLDEFMYDRELKCRAASCKKTHTVERKDAMSHWYKTTLDLLDNEDDLNTPVSESDLSKVAKEIGYEYWMLGIVLGCSNQQLNTLSATHDLRKERCTFVFQYMVIWMKREGERATKQRLSRAIHAARLCLSRGDKITPVIF